MLKYFTIFILLNGWVKGNEVKLLISSFTLLLLINNSTIFNGI